MIFVGIKGSLKSLKNAKHGNDTRCASNNPVNIIIYHSPEAFLQLSTPSNKRNQKMSTSTNPKPAKTLNRSQLATLSFWSRWQCRRLACQQSLSGKSCSWGSKCPPASRAEVIPTGYGRFPTGTIGDPLLKAPLVDDFMWFWLVVFLFLHEDKTCS